MFTRSAQYYDIIYSSIKDYPGEAQKIADLIHKLHPEARNLLDVACGTAEHVRLLHENYDFRVDGIDLDENLLAMARQKIPAARFELADMTSFDLQQKYDVVMCLFSSIGYVLSLENVRRTLECFKHHLSPGGLIIVEPWFTPESWRPGQVFMKTVDSENLKICRMSSSAREGRVSKLRFEYLIGTPGEILHETEDHVLGLFTVEEMTDCFRSTGLQTDYDPEGLFGRGLYVAKVGEAG